MLGMTPDPNVYSYLGTLKLLFPAKCQTLPHQPVSEEVKTLSLEPQRPAAFVLDLCVFWDTGVWSWSRAAQSPVSGVLR